MNTLLGLLGTLGVSLASASPSLSRAQVVSDDGSNYLFNVGELIPNTATFHPYLNESSDHDTIFFGFRLQTKYAITLDFGYMWESPDGRISGERLISGDYRNSLYYRILYSPYADFQVGSDFYELRHYGINGSGFGRYDFVQHTSYSNDIYLWPWSSQSDSLIDLSGVGVDEALLLPTNGYNNYFTWLQIEDTLADDVYLTAEDVACLDALIQSEGDDYISNLVTLDYGWSAYQSLGPLFNGVKFHCLPLLSCFELVTAQETIDSSAEWQSGYDNGYSDGFRDGSQSNVGKVEVVNFYDVFSMIVSLPVSFLTKAFDMELYSGTPYAFNPAVFVVSILSILMIWRIVVMVIGLKK